ncbi:tRNA glutamyl-Q(34) synthetase GluQRS [Methylotenera sp. L2L1]|uniref:tRNA glutamyl-Q(34) synthetase GluQRS n=1 Tax=Methylotenera sp. L2L1 TaxID=1502770 RepID=UPI00055F8152|nr:tRNA glutamyl-Q(34) synthetase GluQRS [Methylotenera sp. L2L1]
MYVGRFAPSPTGPLHFGSLVAAVASYCEAKANQGLWLVRMEDVDKPREMKGAADEILHTLLAFGFEWSGEVVYQSQRTSLYQQAFDQLQNNGFIYACSCSRKEIADSATNGIEGLVYPGTCRSGMLQPRAQHAWRVKVTDEIVSFNDAIQGYQVQQLSRDIGDFVLKRADGLFAYQLAVVVDDALQHITHIVRGADLLNSTPRQIYLQQLLGFNQPLYTHIPLAVNNQGEKLSKQNLALPINKQHAPQLIFDALVFLGQNPPLAIKQSSLPEVWQWAIQNWQNSKISHQQSINI